MGRILAIDYGIRRTGLAVTDPLQLIANALDTVSTDMIFKYLSDYLQKEIVETFVIGKPTQMNGTDSETMDKIRVFSEGLAKRFPNVKIDWFDERFTSVMAQKTIREAGIKKQARQNKSLVDKVAAVIILQGYMESKNPFRF